MKAIYAKFTEKSFRYLAVVICFIGDLEISKYIWDKFTNQEHFDKAFAQSMVLLRTVSEKNSMNMQFPPDMKELMYQRLVSTLLFCLGIYIVFHIINYIFFIFKKRWANMYIKFLSWTATFMAPLMGFMILSELPVYAVLFIIQGVGFFFVANGLRYFPLPLRRDP